MWIGEVTVGFSGQARAIAIDTRVKFKVGYYGSDTCVGVIMWCVNSASLGVKGRKIGLYCKLETVDEAEGEITCSIYDKKVVTLLAALEGEASGLAGGVASGSSNLQWDEILAQPISKSSRDGEQGQ